MQVTKGTQFQLPMCVTVPGSLSSFSAQEPGNKTVLLIIYLFPLSLCDAFSLSLSLNAYVASHIMGCDHCKSHEPAPLCLVPHPHLVTSFNPQYFISLLISGNWLLFISVITVLDPLSVITVLDPLSVNTVLDPLSVITVFALIYRTA